MEIPAEIIISPSLAKPKRGAPTTIQARRKSVPVVGKVQGKKTHYTDKEKLNVVCVFAITGNSRRTAEICKVPEASIRAWKSTDWWFEAMNNIIVEKDEELQTSLTKLIDNAVEKINDRIDNGDYIYDAKRGALVRKPVNARDLSVVTATALDKRQLLRGRPTSRVERVSVNDTLLSLAKEFKKFSQAKEVIQNVSVDVVEEIVEEVEDEEAETINEMFSE